MQLCDDVCLFYQEYLPEAKLENNVLVGACPLCQKSKRENIGKLSVYLNKSGFFFGYFRCSNGCVPGGFPLWFARLMGIAPEHVPGFAPDRESYLPQLNYPVQNINNELVQYVDRLSTGIIEKFQEVGVSHALLKSLQVGFNGRYIVYPYIQEDGNCYSARCVFPDKKDDFFWHGDENFFELHSPLFNIAEIERCENGSLFICEGEENLLTLKQLGFPGVAISSLAAFDSIDPQQFAHVRTIFIVTSNSPESQAAARKFANRLGFKVRILVWPANVPKNYSLWQLAKDRGREFRQHVVKMLATSKAFSPFSTPEKEFSSFFDRMSMERGQQFNSLRTGFAKFDQHLDGVHGINIIGGAPKVGKSAFLIQVATEMALRKIPVLYYDFENGRHKIYQRTLARFTRLNVGQLRNQRLNGQDKEQYDTGCLRFKEMLGYLRVINDRKLSPEIMKCHVDFIQHETRSDYTVIVIDSLHKLPFKDLSERRTGIDAWLRQMESIRDQMQVSFLVISELSRGINEAYDDVPHMGLFKGSGDIEYSADNAMIFTRKEEMVQSPAEKVNNLWLVASREHAPGKIGEYQVDYPYWGFDEL